MTMQEKLYLDKDLIKSRIEAGESSNSIAKSYGCNPGSLYYFLENQKISTIKKRSKIYGTLDNKKEEILKLFNEGNSIYKISKIIGCAKPSLLSKMKVWGVDCSTKRTGNPNNLLKDKTKLVLELHNQDKSQSEISKIVGHSQSNISKLLDDNNVIKRDWKYSVDETFFEKIDSENKAYILGWWYSDGNVMPDGKCRIQIAEKDKYILEYIQKIMKYNGPLLFYPKRQPQHQNMWCLNIDRVKLKDDLIKLGCYPNKSLTLSFPTLEQVPKNLVHHFVRGYFDGDGSFSNGITITGSYNFVYELKNRLPCNITNIYQRYKKRLKEKSAHQLFIGRKNEVKKFQEWIYNSASIWLERKRSYSV